MSASSSLESSAPFFSSFINRVAFISYSGIAYFIYINAATNDRKKSISNTFYCYCFSSFSYVLLILFFLSLVAALMYMKYAIPEYEINATILIKDEKKGADDSKLLEALNIYSSTKIVENEIEVIQSKELLKEVIGNLSLFASVYEDGHLLARSAYTTSPIAVEVRYPEKIKDIDRVDLSFSKKRQVVKMEGKAYPSNVWSETPYGELKLVVNPHKETKTTKEKLFLTLSSPEQVLSKLLIILRATQQAAQPQDDGVYVPLLVQLRIACTTSSRLNGLRRCDIRRPTPIRCF